MSRRSRSARIALTGGAAVLAVGLIGAPPTSAAPGDRAAGPARAAAPTGPADLDVLYVGAHPDDEASRLSTFGEWRERFGARTGVVTVTRGEGGGNAVGPEEGPALGLIREREERSAVGTAGVTDVYNLDKVDFYYSVSAPLHQQAWGQRDTLARLVRVVRQTTPDVIITMNPAPSPGNHGGHQDAALLATEAYYAAGDPEMFPAQINREGLEAYAPKKLLTTTARGTNGAPGANCATTFSATNKAENIYGVWSGRRAEDGRTWAQIEREAQREYASQGWSGFPDVSADPSQLTCDMFMQIDSRVPFTRGDLTAEAAGSTTILEGATLATPGGLPLGTLLDVSTDGFDVVPGGTTTLDVSMTAPDDEALRAGRMRLSLPAGWTAPTTGLGFRRVAAGATITKSVEVTAPEDAAPGRVLAGVTVRSGTANGWSDQQLEVVPEVQGVQQPLPQVAEFERWTAANGVEQLNGIVARVLTLPSGGSRTVGVDVHNHGDEPATGEVSFDLPAGFEADGPAAYADLAPGETERVEVEVTNTDATLPTSNAGGTPGAVAGDYAYTIETTGGDAPSTSSPALELVPVAMVGDGAAPELDGTVGADEYGAEIDLSRLWEGSACTSAADCSATGWLTRSGDDLYVAVEVTDDTLGTVVAPADCKRHWRMDSVEIAIDPTGTSENTSSTFKVAVLPTTTDGVACASRDADNDQGPIGEFPQVDPDQPAVRMQSAPKPCTTAGCGCPQCGGRGSGGLVAMDEDRAPGFETVSSLNDPYDGYTVEMKIPMQALPDTVDPDRMGFNAFVYDSDTQDLTGQTRIGWSTWGGVQGDPYRWGRVMLDGPEPPAVETQAPQLDFPGLKSVESPQSIQQAIRTGVALSGLPQTPARVSASVVSAVPVKGGVRARIESKGSGTAHLFAMYGGQVVGSVEREVGPGVTQVRIPTSGEGWRVLMAFDSDVRGTASSVAVVPVALR